MLLIDTSVWISVFRDRRGQIRQQLETLIGSREVFLTRFTQLELLQGSLNDQEWTLLSTYLEAQNYVELTPISWQLAARIYYDLRRQGLTVRSPIDCCIAQIAIENDLLLIHNDRDFETITQVRISPAPSLSALILGAIKRLSMGEVIYHCGTGF